MGACALMLASITAQAKKGDIFTIDNLTYTVLTEKAATKTGTVSVKAADTSISGVLSIPETASNNDFTYTVNTVVSSGFKDCTGITSVTMPSTITKLNNYAFSGCSALSSINFPTGITAIPKECFYKCAFTQISLPNTITSLGSFSFGYCEKLTKVVLPENLSTIPEGCFCGCKKLSNIDLSRVRKISKQSFLSCEALTEVSLDSCQTLTGTWIFQDCSRLRKVTLGENVTRIPQQCFDGCKKLEEINLQNIEYIGNEAFGHCQSLRELTWSDHLKEIHSQAFLLCTGLTNVVIPNSVDTLGYVDAFRECVNIESITLPDHIKTIPGGFLRCGDGWGYGKVENIDIPTSVKKIESFCFAGSSIRVLKIPNSVESIGYCNLSSCNSIHTTLPSFLKQCNWGVYSSVGSRFGANRAPTELTFPAYIDTMIYSWQGQQAKYIYVMGDTILKNMARKDYKPSDPSVIYVKKSVFFDKFSNGEWDGLTVDYKIPVSMTNASGNPIEYKTLCRDFDVDLTHTNNNLPEGVEPLRAYLVEDVDGDLRMVFLNEIKYIPSRLKANTTDSEGNRYQGVDEYVGVVLRGTPGYTYYYEMGEHDYTQGAEGQWLLEDAMAYSGTTYDGNLMAGDANDEFYVYRTVEDADNNEVINYGLNNNRFKIYYKEGWLMYNKAYLQLPKYVSDAIEGDTDAEGNANLTFVFSNADGSTDKVSSIEFNQNCESDIFYNPYGQQVAPNTKGVVINNGKKFVNK